MRDRKKNPQQLVGHNLFEEKKKNRSQYIHNILKKKMINRSQFEKQKKLLKKESPELADIII